MYSHHGFAQVVCKLDQEFGLDKNVNCCDMNFALQNTFATMTLLLVNFLSSLKLPWLYHKIRMKPLKFDCKFISSNNTGAYCDGVYEPKLHIYREFPQSVWFFTVAISAGDLPKITFTEQFQINTISYDCTLFPEREQHLLKQRIQVIYLMPRRYYMLPGNEMSEVCYLNGMSTWEAPPIFSLIWPLRLQL